MFGLNFFKYIVIAIQIIYTHNQKWGIIIYKNDKTAHKQQFSFLLFSHMHTITDMHLR